MVLVIGTALPPHPSSQRCLSWTEQLRCALVTRPTALGGKCTLAEWRASIPLEAPQLDCCPRVKQQVLCPELGPSDSTCTEAHVHPTLPLAARSLEALLLRGAGWGRGKCCTEEV